MGYKIKIIRLNKKLFGFGIIKKRWNYSDIEKTILDIIYLAKNHGLTEHEIKNRIIDLLNYCSGRKIKAYAKHYPKTIRNCLEDLI